MTDIGEIQDIATIWEDGFIEYTETKNDRDVVMIKDARALWQGIVGAIKTRPGELKGVATENFGCGIWNLLGMPMTGLVQDQIEFYVKETVKAFDDVDDIHFLELKATREGNVRMRLEINSRFGRFEGDLLVG